MYHRLDSTNWNQTEIQSMGALALVRMCPGEQPCSAASGGRASTIGAVVKREVPPRTQLKQMHGAVVSQRGLFLSAARNSRPAGRSDGRGCIQYLYPVRPRMLQSVEGDHIIPSAVHRACSMELSLVQKETAIVAVRYDNIQIRHA